MPRHPIHGRFCANPACRRPIEPGRTAGTKYCDSSCRSEAFRLRAEGVGSENGTGAVQHAEERPRRPRSPTAYAVLRRWPVEEPYLGSYVLVGYATATNRRRAIAVIAAAWEGELGPGEYVAVPVRSLQHHTADGVQSDS